MKLTTVKIMRRKNLGNYEHEEITLEAVLAEGEDATTAIVGLKELVHASLESDITRLGNVADEVLGKGLVAHKVQLSKEGEPNATATIIKPAGETPAYPAAKEEKPKAAPRTRATKAAKTDTNEEGQAIPPVIPQEEVPAANAGGASKVVGSVDTKNVSTVESAKPVAAPANGTGKGIVTYDSTVKEHRSRFATYLGQNYPKWTPEAQFGKADSDAKKKYAVEVQTFSKGLHGKPFEDAKGNMLDSFVAELEAFFSHAK